MGSLDGSSNPPVDVPRLLALHDNGRSPLDTLLGETHPLAEVAAAYEALRAGTTTGRAVLLPTVAACPS